MIEKLLRLPYAPLSFSICYQHNKFLLNLWLKYKNYFMLFIEGQGIPGCEYPYDDPSVVVHSSDSHLSPCGCWSSRWVNSSGRARKKLEFKLILWASSSLINLPRTTSCPSQLMIMLENDLPGPLPIGQIRIKSYLPCKNIYLSRETTVLYRTFFQPWELLFSRCFFFFY